MLQLQENGDDAVDGGPGSTTTTSTAIDDWTPVLTRVFQERVGAPSALDKEQLAELKQALKTLKEKEKENRKPDAGRAGLIRRNKAGHVLGLPFEKNTFAWSLARSIVQGEMAVNGPKNVRPTPTPTPPPPTSTTTKTTNPKPKPKKPAPASHEQTSSSCVRKCFCFRHFIEDRQLKKASADYGGTSC